MLYSTKLQSISINIQYIIIYHFNKLSKTNKISYSALLIKVVKVKSWEHMWKFNSAPTNGQTELDSYESSSNPRTNLYLLERRLGLLSQKHFWQTVTEVIVFANELQLEFSHFSTGYR